MKADHLSLEVLLGHIEKKKKKKKKKPRQSLGGKKRKSEGDVKNM
jgi:hypothetical protein